MESSNQPTQTLTQTLRQPPWTAKNPPNWYAHSSAHVTWHVIVRKPYEELHEFGVWIKAHTRRFVIGQHNADDDDKMTHCHFMVNGCDTTLEGLRKELKKYIKNGREEYSIMTKTHKAHLPYHEWELAVYVIKGDIVHHKLSGYTKEQMDDIVSAWQNYETADPKEKITTQYELIKAMLPKMKHKGVMYQGEYGDAFAENAVVPCQENFRIMCDELNAHEVRTSRNELERIWVTLLRQHKTNQDALYSSISNSVFR